MTMRVFASIAGFCAAMFILLRLSMRNVGTGYFTWKGFDGGGAKDGQEGRE